jgi:molecular chaperone GrpE
MVEKKEEDNQQEENKEPVSENIENEEEVNESQENTDTEETSENENTEEDNFEKEIETLKEEKIRLLAEMENLRKRFEREKVETIKFGSINLARDILSPGDNLERALDALPEDANQTQSCLLLCFHFR